jgi:hypothetical protein
MTTKKKAAKKATPARKAAKRPSGSAKFMAIAANPKKTDDQRIAAFAAAPLSVCEDDKSLQAALTVLRDKNESTELRMTALQALQSASFSVATFESCRAEYLAALREVATDPDLRLRQRALGTLMRNKDGYAQKKLLAGLENPDKALVSPEKALQLLSNDVHAEAYAIARKIVDKPPNPDAKTEALRLLAADAKSAPLFEKVLRDKDEFADNRQIAASALQALRPEKFQETAREIVMDKSDYPEIQATSLTALTHFGDESAVGEDQALRKSVESISAKAPKAKQSAQRFLKKFTQ